MQDNNIKYRIPTPNIDFQPPVYYCLPNKKPFCLDGNLNKDFWNDIPYTDDFADISGPGFATPRYRTRAKMCWDKENLYIAALLEGDEIWAAVTGRDEIVFADNDFEVFIDPDSDTHHYYEFEMNALNTVWDLLLTKPYRNQGTPVNSWDIKGLQTAVHIDGRLNEPGKHNHSWSVEIVFPFTSFMEGFGNRKHPSPGEYWRVNFSRVQWQVDITDGVYIKRLAADKKSPLPEDNWVWAPTGIIDIHYPELWGFVFFVNSREEQPIIPDIENQKWILRQLYYLEHRHYDTYGRFTKDVDMLTAFPVTIEITSHSFEIGCRTLDDTGLLFIREDGKVTYLPDYKEK